MLTNVAFGQALRILDSRSKGFDKNDIPIFSSRIVRVPLQEAPTAMALLGKADFAALTLDQAKKMAETEALDPQAMLNAQSSAADDYAAERELEAGNPFFASSKGWMLQEAKAHRDYAAYTRTLSPHLHAYLIKAKAFSFTAGVFSVKLDGDHLDVFNGALGSSMSPLQPVPIIVFVEREIASVSADAEMAQ